VLSGCRLPLGWIIVSRSASDYTYFDEPFACMAHRGGYVRAADAVRENSMYAFQTAVELGYRYLETDVHATRDGELIAFHDDQLDRVTDATGKINELSMAQIKQARIAGIDPIPTLAELLETFSQTRLNIDIKAPEAIEPLAETLRRHGAQQRVCVSSFSPARLRRFQRLTRGEVATGTSAAGVALAAYLPLVPGRLPSPGVCYQIPVAHELGGRLLPVFTRTLRANAAARGARVHVWTVNDPELMHRLIDLGVHGLISDRVDVLRQVAMDRGLWTG